MHVRTLLRVSSLLVASSIASAQGAPDIVWEEPTPGLLDNSVQAVGWSPVADDFAVGSTDRWLRMRDAGDGALAYSVLEPQHSHGVVAILFSHDGALMGVRNQSSGLSFRVQRASDGLLLGSVIGTVGANGLVSFAPDAMLLGNVGGDGTLSSWNFAELTVFQTTGSGYQKVTTAFNFSPDGSLQTAAKNGTITVRRTSDAAVVKILRGGPAVTFSPDGATLAAWSFAPRNEIVTWRTSNWSVIHHMSSPNQLEGVSAIRFTLESQRIVATGYAPYQDQGGLWQQTGFIRFWGVAAGTIVVTYDQGTDLAVTSSVAWSPDGSQFGYGLYNGTVAVATTPP